MATEEKERFTSVLNIPVTEGMKETVSNLAEKEERPVAAMGRVLIGEALKTRGIESEAAEATAK